MRIPIAMTLIIALSACASSPERQAKMDEINRTIPTCLGEKDCKAKWEMAQVWIVKNAGYKLQTATDVLLQTYSPVGSSTSIGVRALKEPAGDGRYKITVSVWCDNMFGCFPDAFAAAIDFNRTVGAASP
jgi:hypothetical protein